MRRNTSKTLKREHRRQRTGLGLRDFARNYAALVGDHHPLTGELNEEMSPLPRIAVRWMQRKRVRLPEGWA